MKKGGVKGRFPRKAGNENEDPQQPTLTSTSDKKPLKINKSKKKVKTKTPVMTTNPYPRDKKQDKSSLQATSTQDSLNSRLRKIY